MLDATKSSKFLRDLTRQLILIQKYGLDVWQKSQRFGNGARKQIVVKVQHICGGEKREMESDP